MKCNSSVSLSHLSAVDFIPFRLYNDFIIFGRKLMNLSVSVLRQKYRRYGEYMWYAALILLLIPVYLGFCDTASLPLLKYALLLGSLMGYCLLGLKIYFLDGRGPKELALFTGIFLLLGLGVVFSGTRALFSVFLLALGARDVPFSRIAKLCLCFFLGVLALNTLLVFAGVLEDTLLIRGEVWGRGNVRHTLGFGYPNTLALWGMAAVFAALLVFPRSFRGLALCLVFSLGLFALTDSKAACFSQLAALFLCLLLRFLGPKLEGKKWVPWVCGGLVALAAFGFVALSLLYRQDSRIFALLNTIFSQRLGYANQGFRLFGISLFGARVDFGWDPVDSLYAYGPICLGLVPSLLYLALAVFCACRAAGQGKWEMVAVLLAASLYCTMEYGLINPILVPVFGACARLSEAKGEQKP